MCDTTNELNMQQDLMKEKDEQLVEMNKKLAASANMGSVGMKLGKRKQGTSPVASLSYTGSFL